MANNQIEILKMKDTNKKGKILSPEYTDEFTNYSSPKSDRDPLANSHTMSPMTTSPVSAASPSLNKENVISEKSQKITRRKISDFILDKPFRIRSYLRRRPIPLKRCLELDVQCGTRSFHLQISRDIDEAVYCGAKELVDLFLSKEGIKLSNLHNMLMESRQLRSKGNKNGWEGEQSGSFENDSDEDFYDTVKNKNKKEKEARAESAKRMSEVEFLSNPLERAKKFKSGKEGIISKISELESVCGVSSLTIIVNTEKDLMVFKGDPALTTALFTKGVKRGDIPVSYNVRMFDCDEVEYNVCSVPACVVSRNTLGKWRQAAMEQFLFPPELPLSLHVCPEKERDRWMAEIDLDPNNKARVVVCSLHFKDGYPTKENPFPTELLGEGSGGEEVVFRGKRPDGGGSFDQGEWACREANKYSREVIDLIMESVEERIDMLEMEKERELKRIKENEERRKREIMALKGVKYLQFNIIRGKKKARKKNKKITEKRVKLKLVGNINLKSKYKKVSSSFFVQPRISSKLYCRFCSSQFNITKSLYHHIRTVHIAPIRKRLKPVLEITPAERSSAMEVLYPINTVKQLDTKKKYVCAVCKSVCDLFGLFLHMKTVHHGLLCQYCLKLFKKVKDLESHLGTSHRVPSRYYSSKEQLVKASGDQFSLACGECSMVVSLDQLETHECSDRKQFECLWCKQAFNSKMELEQHIVNMWCPKMQGRERTRIGNSPRDVAVLYNVLTGLSLEMGEQDTLMQDMMDTGINRMLQVDIGLADDHKQVQCKQPFQVSKKKPSVSVFSCADRNVLLKYGSGDEERGPGEKGGHLGIALDELPVCGTVFCGNKSRGINNHVKKEFKDLGVKLDLATELLKQGGEAKKLQIDKEILGLSIEKAGKNFIIAAPRTDKEEREDVEEQVVLQPTRVSRRLAGEQTDEVEVEEVERERTKQRVETKLERIQRYQEEIDVGLKELRGAVGKQVDCLFCQQCHTVWVEAAFLLSHMVVVHSGGEREQEIIGTIKKYLRETRGKEVVFRFQDTEQFSLDYYRCSYCSTTTCNSYSDLFTHTASSHSTKVLTCNICQNIFLNYGSLISHVCSGPPTTTTAKARFACKMCHKMDLSSFLEFQLHIRSCHHTCEICFQPQGDQRELYKHCAKHEQDLMCMKCFVTFERVESFRKHLHLRHSGEAVACGSCWAPTWPHVYHFCLPDLAVSCPVCEAVLPNTAAYRVHQRKHTGVAPHACTQCGKGFISKSLLWKHMTRRHPEQSEVAKERLKEKKLKRDTVRLGAISEESVLIAQNTVDEIFDSVFVRIQEELKKLAEKQEQERIEAEKEKSASPPKAVSALDAAIMSIMPQEEKGEPGKGEDSGGGGFSGQPDRAAIQASIAGRTYTADNSWQAGLDALLAGAGAPVPSASALPPAQLLQGQDGEAGGDRGKAPVIGGLWNQDLMFIGGSGPQQPSQGPRLRGPTGGPRIRAPAPVGSNKVLYPNASGNHTGGLRTLQPSGSQSSPNVSVAGIKSLVPNTQVTTTPTTALPPSLTSTQWDLDLSESSGDEIGPQAKRTPALKARTVLAPRPLLDHDYCYAAFLSSQQPVQPIVETQELSEMDKILSNVAFGGFGEPGVGGLLGADGGKERERGEKKKKKKKKKKKRKKEISAPKSGSSTDSESEIDVGDSSASVDMFGIQARQKLVPAQAETPQPRRGRGRPKKLTDKLVLKTVLTPGSGKRGPKPKYHTPDAAKARGVMAGTARPSFDTDSSGHETDSDNADREKVQRSSIKEQQPPQVVLSDSEVGSSDLDTDFSAEEEVPAPIVTKQTKAPKSNVKSPTKAVKPTLKLKIKLPPHPERSKPSTPVVSPTLPQQNITVTSTPTNKTKVSKKRRRSSAGTSNEERDGSRQLSKKMRESLALNSRVRHPTGSGSEEGGVVSGEDGREHEAHGVIARPGYNSENEKLYCYCQCPHDEVSEMIGCDAPDCRLEWFHFECVGIMIPPEGKWYCPECTKRYGL